MTDRRIICRARLSDFCLHGERIDAYYEEPLWEMDDGTYDPASASVVCNVCYVDLMPLTRSGQALLSELEEAIHQHHNASPVPERQGRRGRMRAWLRRFRRGS